jgi:hypothetical protein
MILIRALDENSNTSKEVKIDEIDFDLVVVYLKSLLIDHTVYKVEVMRFWDVQASAFAAEGK